MDEKNKVKEDEVNTRNHNNSSEESRKRKTRGNWNHCFGRPAAFFNASLTEHDDNLEDFSIHDGERDVNITFYVLISIRFNTVVEFL